MPNERQKRYSKKKQAEVADIGEIPPIVNPSRRAGCATDLFLFLTTYFPNSTGLSPFSDDHRRVIERVERCILVGGLFVNAVYRGFGKTTIAQNTAIWATLYGHRRYVPVFGSGQDSADTNIESIKLELSENDLLYEDFPEVCHAVRALEGKPQRCASQTYEGKLTHIVWRADTIVLPQIAGSLASGNIITTRGLSAGSRGMVHKRTDGTQQRPDFVILDDPQTDESAGTPLQVTKRLGIIKKSILKLGGHNRKIAVVMNATVIRQDDLIEQVLDPKRNPTWQGERIKMVKRWSDSHDSMWMNDYARIRTTFNRDDVDDQQRAHKEGTAYYNRNRVAMDKGCIVSWQHCYDLETETSAIQHAYNSLIDDGADVFASECQNEPTEEHADSELLKAHEIAARLNGLARGVVPLKAEHLTAFVDVQGDVLYWLVTAWASDFTGAVIDYGAFPEQDTEYFSLKTARRTLTKAYKGSGLEARIYSGLEAITDKMAKREWKREDGAIMRLGRQLIDANWPKSTESVNTFCRRSTHAAILLPSHGRYVGASTIPWEHFTRREGERLGFHWMIPSLKGKPSATRHFLIDTNFWKSFVHTRLLVPFPDKGSLTLFGKEPETHRLLSDHLTAEYRVQTEGRGRKVDEWKAKPGHQDNHWLDCLAGCAAAASMSGCGLMGSPVKRAKAKPRRKVSYLN